MEIEEKVYERMTRSEARKQAFLLTYEKSFKDDETIDEIIDLAIESRGFRLNKFAESEANGVAAHIGEIQELIGKYAIGWSTGRISHVDMAILALAVYEMKFNENVPESVAINEAVELAKQFSSGEAPAFINGILGSISRGKPTAPPPALVEAIEGVTAVDDVEAVETL